MSQKDFRVSEEPNKARKPYSTPRLTKYGSVQDLTASASFAKQRNSPDFINKRGS